MWSGSAGSSRLTASLAESFVAELMNNSPVRLNRPASFQGSCELTIERAGVGRKQRDQRIIYGPCTKVWKDHIVTSDEMNRHERLIPPTILFDTDYQVELSGNMLQIDPPKLFMSIRYRKMLQSREPHKPHRAPNPVVRLGVAKTPKCWGMGHSMLTGI